MKNQYFGDINDYRKYGLLRQILLATNFTLLMGWMLTPDDGGTDGKFFSYLKNPDKWAHHDPTLFHELRALLAHDQVRRVSLIENTGLLRGARYFPLKVPDGGAARKKWFRQMADDAIGSDLVFLDPDNGLEVKSRPYGRMNSSKYLYWHEVEVLWSAGRSLLIYQHFIREKRSVFIQRMLKKLKISTPGSFVEAFSTPHVLFLLALQPEHQSFHESIVRQVQERWAGQVHHTGLAFDRQ